jgi:predicted Zn-dependent peptidase
MNGTTNADRTNYYNVLPSNQLEMALFMEADRMRSLDINQANFDNQRSAVQEERRLRVDNVAYGISGEKHDEMIYDNFAYKHSIIGSMDDLNAAKLEDVQAFFKTYYAPNNAVLTLVGDFDTKDAIARINKYFGNIPNQPKPPVVDMTEPQQTAERRGTHEDAYARFARVDIAFKAVPGNTDDFYALQVLSSALQGGQSSRLFQTLLRDKTLVTSIGGNMDERRGVGAFNISATVRPDKTAEAVEAAIYEEIERIKQTPIAEWELQKAKNTQKRGYYNSLQSSLARAIALGQYAVFYNDPNLINTRLDRLNAVTAADVQRVAQKYLQSTNRSVLITTPKSKAGGGLTTGAAGTKNEKEVSE